MIRWSGKFQHREISMSNNNDILFHPFTLGSFTIPNRIVMAPMTRSFSPNGTPTEKVAEYYKRRAEDGVGLILSEGTTIARDGSRNDENIPLFYGEAPLQGWSKVIEAVHESGGRMGPQIWHVGSAPNRRSQWQQPDIESPSGLGAPGEPRGRVMSEQDIADSIKAFASAAADAKRLGFDVVEIHGAHGYLVDQFFWSELNKRTDSYGGATLKERSKFAVEVIKSIRAAVGPGFPIILRVSQWKLQNYDAKMVHSPAELGDWLNPLVEAGVDILHCSQRRFWQAEFPELDGEDGLNFAGWAKKVTGVPTISVGSVGLALDTISSFSGESSAPADLNRLRVRMEKGEFDLIAVGRAILNDPHWVTKVRENKTDEFKSFAPSALAQLV
jgi:2,4-dienoyl-CoA reductase-like NADH-dependent reductase (Old Yellow Enzyme family)